jgi:hypothetical protein
MNSTVRRTLVAAATFVWIAMVISPAQALIPPEPGGAVIAPPPSAPEVVTSFWDRAGWMVAGAGAVLALAIVIGATMLLVSRLHHAHSLQPQTH